MDFTNGALNITRPTILGNLHKHIGEPQKANGQFYRGQLLDLQMDYRFFALKREEGMSFMHDIIKPRRYVKNVRDCENLAFSAVTDMSDAAAELGWGAYSDEDPLNAGGAAVTILGYDSKNYRTSGERLGGYHAALAFHEWNPEIGDLGLWIVQPKVIRKDGSIQDEIWSKPENEVNFWSWAVTI